MHKKWKSTIKWLIIFGVILLLSILFGESKTTFRLDSQIGSDTASSGAGALDKQVTHQLRWQLPAAISHVVFAILLTLGIWLCTVIYRNSKQTKELRRSCDRLSESLMRLETGTREQFEELKKSFSELRFETLKQEGKFQFTKDMQLTDALAVHPDVAKVLFTRGLACVSCPSAAGETIERAAQVHGMDVQPILDDLNKLLES